MVVLAYLWPLALIPLLAARHDSEAVWHGKHGIVLMTAEGLLLLLLVLLTLSGISYVFVFVTGSIVLLLAAIAIVTVHGTAMIKGLNGGRLHIPWVSDFANRF